MDIDKYLHIHKSYVSTSSWQRRGLETLMVKTSTNLNLNYTPTTADETVQILSSFHSPNTSVPQPVLLTVQGKHDHLSLNKRRGQKHTFMQWPNYLLNIFHTNINKKANFQTYRETIFIIHTVMSSMCSWFAYFSLVAALKRSTWWREWTQNSPFPLSWTAMYVNLSLNFSSCPCIITFNLYKL